MTKYVLMCATPNGMKLSISSWVYGSEEEVRTALADIHDFDDGDIELIMDEGEIEFWDDEVASYKIQVVS